MQEDPALRSLVLMNAAVVVGALVVGESVAMLLFPYWLQSVVTGLYTTRRLASLRKFTTDGFRLNGRIVPPVPSLAPKLALMFAFHFGFFHLLYFEMMGGFAAMGRAGLLFPGDAFDVGLESLTEYSGFWLAALVVGFLVSGGREHAQNRAADEATRPNIVHLMFTPYARIVPMHLTVLFGSMWSGLNAVLVFGAVKTAVEIAMLKVERRLVEKSSAAVRV